MPVRSVILLDLIVGTCDPFLVGVFLRESRLVRNPAVELPGQLFELIEPRHAFDDPIDSRAEFSFDEIRNGAGETVHKMEQQMNSVEKRSALGHGFIPPSRIRSAGIGILVAVVLGTFTGLLGSLENDGTEQKANDEIQSHSERLHRETSFG